ncbi:ADP-heptose--lipooligosaccharide heptosyltransferase II [hydrothermal vent metagenome]|uniref:Lipopolysaccharide heptosyltransferase 1 n=1 Tax=hydrothermal vent metagenome TaxID=652676 RepID=A0A3B1BTL5_9ZZZZ
MNAKKRGAGITVLIVKISAMGDIVHTFPLVHAIKTGFPDSTVEWVVSDGYVDLARLSPYVDRVIAFRRKRWAGWWRPGVMRELYQFARKIREREYDAVIDLQGLLRSGLVTFAARARKKIGFSYAREGAHFFYNDKIVASDQNVHAIDRYMSSLPKIGIEKSGKVEYGVRIPEEEMEWVKSALPSEPYVVINPNARWRTKRWPIEKFGMVMANLNEREGLRCVITGGPDDVERGERLARLTGSFATDLTNSGGFPRLAAIIAGSVGMITNDSGPMHLAVALNRPVIAIFGPTDPEKTGPYGEGHQVVKADVECSPCYKRRCPLAHECMEGLDPADVLDAWNKVKPETGKKNG